jgi:hypothetical protein
VKRTTRGTWERPIWLIFLVAISHIPSLEARLRWSSYRAFIRPLELLVSNCLAKLVVNHSARPAYGRTDHHLTQSDVVFRARRATSGAAE